MTRIANTIFCCLYVVCRLPKKKVFIKFVWVGRGGGGGYGFKHNHIIWQIMACIANTIIYHLYLL